MNMEQTIGKCRLCLESEKPSNTSMKDGTFRARLAAVSSFMFEDNEQLPSGVCPECSERINQFYLFMETVRFNQTQLHLALPPIQVKNEIFLESSYEQFEHTVKKEPHSPEHTTATMDVEIEMYNDEDPPAAAKDEDENEQDPSSSSPIKKSKRAEITDEDRQIKEFFSLKCETCSESFESFRQLKTHSKKIHNTQATLQCCNKSFTFKRKMLYHINWHLKPCKCDECGKRFPDRRTMKVHHTAKHMSSDEKPFKCDKCDKAFQTESHLRTHFKRHEQMDCTVCKKKLSNIYTLNRHMELVHCDVRNFICDVCGKDFKSRGAVDAHRQQHEEVKREDGVRCEICNKWISRKKYLRCHMTEVHQSKEVTCNICHKVYPNEKSLTTHKGRVHVEEKFECEICGKRFKRNVYLKEHLASHTGQKLYSCEFCGMEMNSNANLYSHKKNKHPEEWMQAKQRAEKFSD